MAVNILIEETMIVVVGKSIVSVVCFTKKLLLRKKSTPNGTFFSSREYE